MKRLGTKRTLERLSTFVAMLYMVFGRTLVFASGTATKGSQWLGTVKNIGIGIIVAFGGVLLLYAGFKIAMALIKKQPGDLPDQIMIIVAGGICVGIGTIVALFT